jgi:hypothetical protein
VREGIFGGNLAGISGFDPDRPFTAKLSFSLDPVPTQGGSN